MSQRGQAKSRAPTSPKQRPKTGYVGSRAFLRQAQALQRRAERKQASKPNKPSLLQLAWESLRRIPRAAWLCAAVACISAVCWSILTPPFQVTDEPSHFAYTQQLAENTKLPTSSDSTFSPEEEIVLRDIRQYEVRQSPETHTISTVAEQQRLQSDINQRPSRHGEGGVGGAYADPPLYYLLDSTLRTGIVGHAPRPARGMRLLSTLMAGLTALFVFLFLRETLPGVRWAWTVGALSVALVPLLGFISGAVNPDSMLTAVSAAIFYGLARAFHRGFTQTLAIVLGTMIAVGFLTKVNFIGLVPGIILGMIVLTIRASRTHGRAAYGWFGLALTISLAPCGSMYLSTCSLVTLAWESFHTFWNSKVCTDLYSTRSAMFGSCTFRACLE